MFYFFHFTNSIKNINGLYNFQGFDDILPNKIPYRPKFGQKATIVVGQPIYLDDIVKKLKNDKLSSVNFQRELNFRSN